MLGFVLHILAILGCGTPHILHAGLLVVAGWGFATMGGVVAAEVVAECGYHSEGPPEEVLIRKGVAKSGKIQGEISPQGEP